MLLINQCSFSSADWGNVSDWVMIIVTIATGYFIWKTLEAQLKLTKIEISRYRTSELPRFETTIEEGTQLIVEDDKFKLSLMINVKLAGGSIAKNTELIFPNDEKWHNSAPQPLQKLKFNSNDSYSFGLKTEGPMLNTGDGVTELVRYAFAIVYTDDIDTPYRQLATYLRFGGIQSITISHPEVLD